MAWSFHVPSAITSTSPGRTVPASRPMSAAEETRYSASAVARPTTTYPEMPADTNSHANTRRWDEFLTRVYSALGARFVGALVDVSGTSHPRQVSGALAAFPSFGTA